MTNMLNIGIRELQHHAGIFLRRAEQGEIIQVTNRGRVVARIVPGTGDPWQDMLDSGQILMPTEQGDLADERPFAFGSDAADELATIRGSVT
jgi:prevent-host-death family protein